MARVSQTQWTRDRSGKSDAEPSSRPTATIVPPLVSETLELERPELVRADQFLVCDRLDFREAWPALQLLQENVPNERSRRSIIFGPVALGPP